MLWGKLLKKINYLAKWNLWTCKSLFKEATTAFVQKCCQRQHRIKGACMCINQLIQSFNTWLEGYIPKNPRCTDLLWVTHDLDIVFVVRPGNNDLDVRKKKKSLNNLISSPEPKNIWYQAKMKIQTENNFFFVVLTERMKPLISGAFLQWMCLNL